MKKLLLLTLLAIAPVLADSHIGSPGVTFEGKAGNYSVLVLVTPPEVIPGTATVDIYTKSSGIASVWAKPVYWFAGDEGTPSADEMLPVEGEPGHYRGIIWLMNSGSSGIEIEIKGNGDGGTVLVPVMALSTAQKTMPRSLGWTLAILAIFLVILMVTIIGASVSDGLVKPGSGDVQTISRKRLRGAIVSAVVLMLILWGGKSWWDGWSSRYRRFLYRPLQATSTLEAEASKQVLVFKIDTSPVGSPRTAYSRRLSLVVPDHGKLMHMFLVRAGSMDVFAHLHPARKDSATYTTPLPPLPAGKYLVFADITRLSGFAETIADTVDIPATTPARLVSIDTTKVDRDDTYFITTPISESSTANIPANDNIVMCGKPGIKTVLDDGTSAIWEHERGQPFTTGKVYELTFSMQDASGQPAKLEPYLGMMGHAVVMKEDGTTYIHLHPVGNYSMASQQTMLTRFQNETGPVNWSKIPRPAVFMDSIDRVVTTLNSMPEAVRNHMLMGNMDHSSLDTTHQQHSVVKFPYAFPSPGNYRIWIQMKRNGRILNSAFEAVVE